MTAAPWYYPIFVGQTHDKVIEALGDDAFRLTAATIVDALIDRGYTPDVLDPSREPLPSQSVTTMVRQDDRTFMVSVDEAGGTIAVQEVRTQAYPDE